jgi:hypothetical protein
MRSRVVVALGCLLNVAVLTAHAADQPDELMPGRIVVIKYGGLSRMIGKPAIGSAFELPDATNDPTANGATLLVFDDDPSRPVTAEIDLQASAWTALGNPPGSTGYRYKRPAVPPPGQTCRVVLIRKSIVKAVCEGGGYLPTPFMGQAGVVLTVGGSSKRYCALFGGEESSNDSALLKRKGAPAPGACPLDLNSSTTSVTSTTVTTTSGPPGLHCCHAGSTRCWGGFTWDECLSLGPGITPVAGAVCDASNDCVSPPGTTGGCCDGIPLFGVCSMEDATECASDGGTFHPASVCDPSGSCTPP